MAEFGEHVLGKGIVYAKDTPNFIGNRIGTFGMTSVFHWMKELGLGVTEVDKIFGPAMGRPKSAVFRTADVVGLDTMAHVLTTVAESCPDDPWRSRFEVPAPMQELITRGSLGEKSGAGFYKKTRDEAGERKILALDLDSLDYEEQTDVRFDSIGVARARARAGDKVEAMVWYDDEAGRMAWKVTAEICSYAAELLGEIADDVVNVDRALRWGFNYEMGPFQTWDAVGVERSVQRMRDEGMKIPPVVDTMVAESEGTWYVKRDGLVHYWDVEKEDYLPVPVPERHISIQLLADRGKQLDGNNGATIYNLGDGVGLVEFHTKMNSIDNQIVEVIERACDLVNEGELAGLVVGNEAPNFSVGANIGLLGMLATAGMWDELDRAVAAGQNANMKMKYCRGPVVAAPRGMTLGGGCEVTLHSDAVRAAAETYFGQVEVGVGLIPAAGGCKELAFRYYGSTPPGVKPNPFAFIEKIFTTIGMGTTSSSAEEARDHGFLRPHDRVTINPDALLADAKADVLALVQMGYQPPTPTTVPVPGRDGIASLKVAIHGMRGGGYISGYDQHLANRLAYVICGGDVPAGTELTEQGFLNLEREVFVELCHEEKTQERIQHMLQTGKALRN
jgi:3-hydroxyacyl-CoA dehydrogenase